MSITPASQKTTTKKLHKVRFVWVVMPVILTALFIIFFLLALAIPSSLLALNEPATQLGIISNIMLICFALCPVMLCLSLVYMFLVVSIFGTHKMNNSVQRSIRRAGDLSHTTAEKTAEKTDILNHKSIELNARFAFLSQIFESEEKGNHDDE